jgi:tetratricopeptide (TPR) repeat protein
MSRKRYAEAEDVAKRLVALDSKIPTPYFILSDALTWQGKFEEATLAVQEGKSRVEPDQVVDRGFDEKIRWLKNAIDIWQTLTDSTQDPFPDLSSQELQEVAKICEMKGKTEQALKYYRLSVTQEIDAGRKSLLRHSILVYFVHSNLTNSGTQRSTRNLLCQATVELLSEQLEFARRTLESPDSTDPLRTQAMELLGMWKSRDEMYRFIEDAAEDARVDPEIRSKLAAVIRETSELYRLSMAASQLGPAD